MAQDVADEGGDIQDFILARELAEVYLLLDHISSTQAKSVPMILDDDPVFGTSEAQMQRGWIEQICEIAWPPRPEDRPSAREEARNAAKLIRAKDLLNNRAFPATGATIAFTVMMAGEAGNAIRLPWWRRILVRLAGYDPEARRRREAGEDETGIGWASQRAPSRGGLAARAYPALAASALFYRALMYALLLGMVGWLTATCFLSWDVATGSALLNRYNSLEARIVDLRKAAVPGDPASPVPIVGETSPLSAPTDERPAPAPAQAGGAQTEGAEAGDPPETAPAAAPDTATTRDNANRSDIERAIAQQAAAARNLRKWLDAGGPLRRFLIALMGGENWDKPAEANSIPLDRAELLDVHVEWAAVALGILANSVLPIFYGLLGAGAAVVRSVSARMRESLLSPRDIVLAYVRLALGAVIGACIGLFVTPDGTQQGQQGLLGPIHMSASALCFVAGFGVEGVFQAMESLVQRLFNLDPARTPTPGTPAADATKLVMVSPSVERPPAG
ncbi:hypothetical protein RZN05_06145 [Sphingomonas sp. HF-S4]|uniref:Uncharacterized protein n=1 Tax=Sphingomonas agrestis TaxID=3080540 RepID=A0ABU3Y573_9SPHN|nr:hypothetical protein [Sphingomonas sp. HF-S4]MDV3456559.1 hypothetical protein [Sphingomonas sp. HF-S4]